MATWHAACTSSPAKFQDLTRFLGQTLESARCQRAGMLIVCVADMLIVCGSLFFGPERWLMKILNERDISFRHFFLHLKKQHVIIFETASYTSRNRTDNLVFYLCLWVSLTSLSPSAVAPPLEQQSHPEGIFYCRFYKNCCFLWMGQ